MAYFSGVLRSQVLAMDTLLHVILPYDRPSEQQQEPCKVLYLLHGMGENAAAWTRYTAVERYAREYGMAVIMPEVQRSFYCDMEYGLNYYTYIVSELPEICARMFHISTKREDSYIAGLSMGGYGALKCAFCYPQKYCACASFSGAVDIVQVMADNGQHEHIQREFTAVLGPELKIQDQDNLLCLAGPVSRLPPEQQPDIFVTCGRDDFLCSVNRSFSRYLETLPLRFTYQEWQGEHNWTFWDESIKRALSHWAGMSAGV